MTRGKFKDILINYNYIIYVLRSSEQSHSDTARDTAPVCDTNEAGAVSTLYRTVDVECQTSLDCKFGFHMFKIETG